MGTVAGAAIVVRGLSKQYTIQTNASDSAYRTFRGALEGAIRSVGQRARGYAAQSGRSEGFWAVQDVTFEVAPGERLGVIGRNGAGKSTLLKLLSRITEPTTGRIELRGRLASLLEVGTGFHPELTGRENIFLNGAILGMRRAEIARKFDAIVAFAEVERFLETPVKRYSSGMYVRLAFAVAAHLDPEILVIDEVLAVGDLAFQRKCLGRIEDVARGGRTVLFVSHQMAMISHLCTSCLVLDRGRVVFHGPTAQAIERYLELSRSGVDTGESDLVRCRAAWAEPLITSFRLLDLEGNKVDAYLLGSTVVVEMRFDVKELPPLRQPVMGVVVNHPVFGVIGGVNTRMTGFWPAERSYRRGVYRCYLPDLPLLPGSYRLDLWLADGPTNRDHLRSVVELVIDEADVYGTGLPPYADLGAIFLRCRWEMRDEGADA